MKNFAKCGLFIIAVTIEISDNALSIIFCFPVFVLFLLCFIYFMSFGLPSLLFKVTISVIAMLPL